MKGSCRVGVLAAAALALLGGALATTARNAHSVYFPEGYRQWTLVRFRFIGPENPGFATQGGLRHYFANSKALAGFPQRRFRDGSVIVDERVHAALNQNGIWEETGLAHVAVMRKDSKRHADTGGWQFNLFTTHDTAMGLAPAQARARCFEACHKSQSARDYVFSDPRR